MPKKIDLTGRIYGRLTVLQRGAKPAYWLCRCACGVEKEYFSPNLNHGKSQSCGCIRAEKNNHITHEGTGTLTYKRWLSMRARCLKKSAVNYSQYGGAGITICQQWDDFSVFLADMGECPEESMTLDRIKNELGYSKENCRWATRIQQQRNTTNNRILTLNNESMCVAEWAEVLEINSRTIMSRLNKGWTEAEALSTPVRPHKPYNNRGHNPAPIKAKS